MDNNEILDDLIAHIMSERQAKVYLSILNSRGATAAELQRISGIPTSKIYGVVDYLVNNGFCLVRQVGNKRTYEATDPKNALISNIRQLENRIGKINSLSENLTKLFENTVKHVETNDYIETIKGNSNVHNKHVSLLRQSNKDFLHFTKPPFAFTTDEERKVQEEEYFAFIARGGQSRYIYEANGNSSIKYLNGIKAAVDFGFNFRVCENLPLKMTIFDREVLLVSEETQFTEGELSMTVIKKNVIVRGHITLFDFFWNQGTEPIEWLNKNEHLFK